MADDEEHEAHRQTASLLADAIAEHQTVLRRMASALDDGPDGLYEVAAKVQESRPLNTLRLSLPLVDSIVSCSGLNLDDLLLEFIPAAWVDEARRVLDTVTRVEEAAMPRGDVIADLLVLRDELAAPNSCGRSMPTPRSSPTSRRV